MLAKEGDLTTAAGPHFRSAFLVPAAERGAIRPRRSGFLFRKNIITVFMSIELMLNAVNLTFVAFSYQFKQVDGHIFAFFVMVVAAAEAAVGLGDHPDGVQESRDAADRRGQQPQELSACSISG